jgi:lipopolysaccharide export system protein LptC
LPAGGRRLTESLTVARAFGGRSLPPRGHARRAAPRRGYRLFVTMMKFLLPTAAAGLIVVVALWSQFNLDETRFRIGAVRLSTEDVESVRMVNPRYEGIDEKSRPFSITADLATQPDGASDTIDLAAPKADITLSDGAWIAISAESGRYERQAGTLELKGAVSLFHDAGYELHTNSARIDLKQRSAVGQEKVEGQGPSGELQGQGFALTEGGESVQLTGQSRVVLYPTMKDLPK